MSVWMRAAGRRVVWRACVCLRACVAGRWTVCSCAHALAARFAYNFMSTACVPPVTPIITAISTALITFSAAISPNNQDILKQFGGFDANSIYHLLKVECPTVWSTQRQIRPFLHMYYISNVYVRSPYFGVHI